MNEISRVVMLLFEILTFGKELLTPISSASKTIESKVNFCKWLIRQSIREDIQKTSFYISVLAHPSNPAAIFGLCDILPKTFDLNSFLPFYTLSSFNGGSTPHGGGWLYHHPGVYEPCSQDICRLQQNILDMTDL